MYKVSRIDKFRETNEQKLPGTERKKIWGITT